MTGGEAAVATLIDEGVTRVFGLPGIQNDWFYNALYDARGRIDVIHTRHEQGAAYMALGAALASGELSVCNVVPGPGVLNASAALATADCLNAPVLMLCGQVPRPQIGCGIGTLHEIPDQLAILRQFTKVALRAESAREIPAKLGQALSEQRSGCPGPVAVEIPMDVLAERAEVDLSSRARSTTQPEIDAALIDEAARLLGRSEHPLIFVGNGALRSSAHVGEISDMLQAPVVAYRTGRGVLDSRHYLSCTLPEARPLWAKCDLALILGASARGPLLNWGSDEARLVVRIDADETAHERFGTPTMA